MKRLLPLLTGHVRMLVMGVLRRHLFCVGRLALSVARSVSMSVCGPVHGAALDGRGVEGFNVHPVLEGLVLHAPSAGCAQPLASAVPPIEPYRHDRQGQDRPTEDDHEYHPPILTGQPPRGAGIRA